MHIGAFVIILASIYIFARMKKIDLLASFRNRKISKGGSRGWYGWRQKRAKLSSTETAYPSIGYSYPSDEKVEQRSVDSFFDSMAKPTVVVPQNAATRSGDEPPQQYESQSPVVPSQLQETVPKTFNSPDYNNTYNTYNTNTTYLTQNTSEVYDPGQREVNHLSYLSSLSSGFGDAQINIPESDPTRPNPQNIRESSHQSRKFSWVSSVPGFRRQGDRDTVYTTSSVDSAPRFRTVTSWVAQQSGRLERRQPTDGEVPNVPEIPQPLRIGVTQQRNQSDDPAFRYHPGEEVVMSRGSCVPSDILDKKVGFD